MNKIGEAGNEVMKSVNRADGEHETPLVQEELIGMAKVVASSTASLVIASKSVASACDHQQGVNEVIALVTQCALCTSQLVSCTKVCASTVGSRECQAQIAEAARQVSRHLDAVVESASGHCQSDKALGDLRTCARHVAEALSQLIESVRGSDHRRISDPSDTFQHKQEESIEKIFAATDSLFANMGDTGEMIRQAKVLAQATTELVNALKQEAHAQSGSEQQRKLLMAAKLLAEATSKVVEAAKSCATHPNDARSQEGLKKAAEDLKNATAIAAGDSMQNKLIKRLEICAKQAASCATQAIAAIQVCTYHPSREEETGTQLRQGQSHLQLIQQCKLVADNVPKIVQGIRGCMSAPDSKSAQIGLVNSCEDFVPAAHKMTVLAKAVLPTIADEIKAIQLRNCTNQLEGALGDLRSVLGQAQQVCGSFEADAMIESIRDLDNQLLEVKNAALASTLRPLPGETVSLFKELSKKDAFIFIFVIKSSLNLKRILFNFIYFKQLK